MKIWSEREDSNLRHLGPKLSDSSIASSGSEFSAAQATQLEAVAVESAAARKVVKNDTVTSADNSTSIVFDDGAFPAVFLGVWSEISY